jgi:SAM-dependent methyltransferase
MMKLDLTIAPEAIEAVIDPYVVARYAHDDPEWRAIVDGLDRKTLKRMERFGDSGPQVRGRDLVEDKYGTIWRRSVEEELTSSRPTPFEWSHGGFVAHSIVRKRIHQLLLVRVFEALRPKEALEVGCGNGLNLLLLSGHFPAVTFAGLELTSAGAHAARALTQGAILPDAVRAFAVARLHDPAAHRRVSIVQGSAEHLPFAAGSVDVIFTVLALEQMRSIQHAALSELRRVASGHVVMIEPFHDWNVDGLRRRYITASDYFDARVDELKAYGLEPVFVMSDVPNKVLFHVGLVVARVVG